MPFVQCPSQQGSPQGLRRPRFSFFRFTCQTAQDLTAPLSGKPESRRSATLSIRIESLGHRISVRCFSGAKSRREADGAPYDGYIVFRRVGCQHLSPKIEVPKSRLRWEPVPAAWPPRPSGRGAEPSLLGKSPEAKSPQVFYSKSPLAWANLKGRNPRGPESCATCG